MTQDPLATHYGLLLRVMFHGRLVPFLGAGASVCERPENFEWTPDQRQHLPLGGELARFLGETYFYPRPSTVDLARVSQYVDVVGGEGLLYDEMRLLFDADYPITTLHRFLASLPSILPRERSSRSRPAIPRRLLLVTTNYDDLLERALEEAGEEYHLVTYLARGEAKGKFLHRRPEGSWCLIESPNDYKGLLDEVTVVLKLHGAFDREDAERDSFVITEDDYINYLARLDVSHLVPAPLAAMLRDSHLLFLGYGLEDWNLRVILHRIWEKRLRRQSWAVQMRAEELEMKLWGQRGVEIIVQPLDRYISGLESQMKTFLAGDRAAGGMR